MGEHSGNTLGDSQGNTLGEQSGEQSGEHSWGQSGEHSWGQSGEHSWQGDHSTGKIAKKNSLHGKLREFEKFSKTQGKICSQKGE